MALGVKDPGKQIHTLIWSKIYGPVTIRLSK